MNIKVKDPGSAATHFIGLCLTAAGAVPLLAKSFSAPSKTVFISMLVFICSMMMLYTASTVYHTFDISPDVNRRLQKLDHMSIYILIAGTYTPVCLVALSGTQGTVLCILVWSLAAAGCLINALWITCPKWFSSMLYIAMGWIIIFKGGEILSISRGAFLWLFIGGIIYTIGGVIYALRLPIFNGRHKNFGSHEIFHLFVMGGSFCHFMMMLLFFA